MCITDDPRPRFQACGLCGAGAGQNECGGTVIDARGIARRDGPVLLENSAQTAQRLQCCGLWVFVRVKSDHLAFAFHLDGNNLVLEMTRVNRSRRAVLALQCEGVLISARDVMFCRDVFRSHPHMAGPKGAV